MGWVWVHAMCFKRLGSKVCVLGVWRALLRSGKLLIEIPGVFPGTIGCVSATCGVGKYASKSSASRSRAWQKTTGGSHRRV